MGIKTWEISSSANGQFTGSITKVLALGADNDEPTISRIEFGEMTDPESNFTPSSETSTVKIPAGTYIDGPIGKLKVGATGGFLVYIRK